MKKLVVWAIVMIFLINNAFALNLVTLDSSFKQKSIFKPGSVITFKADAQEDADSVVLIILQNNNPVATERMQLFSDEPRQYAYKLDGSLNQGDYVAKVISKGEKAEAEFYVGYEIKGELMARKNIGAAKKASLLEQLLKIIRVIVRILPWIGIRF